MTTEEKIDPEIKRLLKVVADSYEKEDIEVRYRQIRQWRKLKLYWAGFTNIWYDEVAHDWKVYDQDTETDSTDQGYYDKPINIFRAYLESIIAALSITIPAISAIPDDADNPLDISTAKASSKIATLIYKQNDVALLWLHALYILATEGMTGAYSYSHEDKKYGEVTTPEYKEDTVEKLVCPNCNETLPDEIFDAPDDLVPTEEVMELPATCPECGFSPLIPGEVQKIPTIELRFTGNKSTPKTRQKIEVYGGLNIKVSNYARRQSECGYLRYAYETHYASALERWPDLDRKLIRSGGGASGLEQYERWARLSPEYAGDYPTDVVTISSYWFRPWAFNCLDKEDAELLKKEYSTGVKVIYVNDQFAEACEESLDDHWTLTFNPLSDYLHFDPLGLLLVSVQDIINDIISLTLQTIEQGIPQTFVDPALIDTEAYRNSEVTVGGIFPTKSVTATKNIAEGFTTLKTATLGTEVLPFGDKVQQLGQLSSGALPSLFGGMAEAGSKTASEYSMSRAQALQRLQNNWKMLTFWWKSLFEKVIISYIEDMIEDERIVEKQGNSYVNVFIRKAEVSGKIGSIELEPNENLPITMQQKKDVLMQLFALNNPIILEALASPENLPFIKEALGVEEFVMPGEEDRQKQYEEIQLLLQSQPIVLPDGIELPSVEVDEILDNHQVEAEICRTWLLSEIGRDAKTSNPAGYRNVLVHMKMHMEIVQMRMQAEQAAIAASQSENNGNGRMPKNPKKDNAAPVKEDNGQRIPIQ